MREMWIKITIAHFSENSYPPPKKKEERSASKDVESGKNVVEL